MGLRKRWIVIGCCLLLALALLFQWPAREAAGLAGLDRVGVVASAWTGSAWRGTGHDLRWGAVRLGRVDWRLAPTSLLLLRPAVSLTVEGPEIRAGVRIRSSLTGRDLAITDATGSAPAAWLQHILRQPFLQLGGTLVADLAEVRFEDGWLTAVTGTTTWSGAIVRGRVEAPLGSIRISWEPVGDAIVGTVADGGGPLSALGTVTVRDRAYTVDVTLNAPRDNVPLRQALDVVGRPDATGAVRLVITGPMVPIR